MNTSDTEIYGESYAGFLWAYLSHFSTYGISGLPNNRPPDVSNAYPSLGYLWPPNRKLVNVTIEGVTDPDGDNVTITVIGITSDEPTKLKTKDKYSPDAFGVGTSVASLRAERDGEGNGRVYVVYFKAEDGRGGEAEGNVTVCVPHDVKKDGVDCVDDGQIYNSTQSILLETGMIDEKDDKSGQSTELEGQEQEQKEDKHGEEQTEQETKEDKQEPTEENQELKGNKNLESPEEKYELKEDRKGEKQESKIDKHETKEQTKLEKKEKQEEKQASDESQEGEMMAKEARQESKYRSKDEKREEKHKNKEESQEEELQSKESPENKKEEKSEKNENNHKPDN